MSDSRNPLAALPREQAGDEAAREERHALLATLLGAFADGELPAETASQIDAHLLGCARCRRELDVHRALRLRLEQELIAAVPSSLRDRIAAAVETSPAPAWVHEPRVGSSPTPRLRRGRYLALVAGLAGLVLAGVVGGNWLLRGRRTADVVHVTSASQPLAHAVLDDFRRVTAGDLPGRARDLEALRGAMPFPVEALRSSQLRPARGPGPPRSLVSRRRCWRTGGTIRLSCNTSSPTSSSTARPTCVRPSPRAALSRSTTARCTSSPGPSAPPGRSWWARCRSTRCTACRDSDASR